jgi:acetyl-CoA/propionyl-CoA carboxylase carboxyl transferase subunit
VMVDKKSFMFVTGPKVVRAVTSENVDTETLGGGRVHAERSGVAHFLVPSELAGLQLARQLLTYFPANNCGVAPVQPTDDSPQRSCSDLRQIVPEQANRPYEARQVIQSVVDAGSFLEVHAGWAQNVRVGLARMAGQPVAILANNPACLAGVLDIDASRKAARFVRTCDAFGLPLISLVDVPGFLPGRDQEHAGIIDHGAKLAYAMCEMTSPKLSVILRKAYGGAYIVMSSKTVGGDMCFAWPAAEIAVMGAPGAVEILYAKTLKDHPEPQAKTAELIEQYNQSFANPRTAQARGLIDAVIEPEQTRQVLCQGLAALEGKRAERLPRRHGNVPL